MNGAKHLALTNVSARFNGFLAVDSLNLAVKAGELRCLIGPNGAGKTTTLDIICGKTKPSSGEIRLGDTVLNNLEEHAIARIGIGRKFQVPSVFPQLTVRENLLVAHSRRPGVLRNALRFRRGEDSDGLDNLAELVGLRDSLERTAGHLSHGQTQWLEIALLLAQDPKLILMDEPTAAISVRQVAEVLGLIRRLKAQGVSVVLISHRMPDVFEVADRIIVLRRGSKVADKETVQTSPEEITGLITGAIRAA
jgi:urea transport system ATP-binding protein